LSRWIALALVLIPSLIVGGAFGYLTLLGTSFDAGAKGFDYRFGALCGFGAFVACVFVLGVVSVVIRYFWTLFSGIG
jgi:hypothetical protein